MYLNYLTEDQQRVFVDAAVLTIRSDRDIAIEEAAFLETVAEETGRVIPGPSAEVSLDDALGEVAGVYLEPAQRRAFAVELAAVCVIDGEVHRNELAILRRFAKALGVGRGELDGYVELAVRAREAALGGGPVPPLVAARVISKEI